MKRMKVVQIGLGHDHAMCVLPSLLAQHDVFELAAFAVPECEEDPFADRIAQCRDELNVPQVSVEEALALPGVEGAVIETEEVNLTRYALMAAQRGLHVHMDKPGGTDAAQFDELIDTLRRQKRTFTTGYMYRFNTTIREAVAQARAGKLGDIYAVEAHMDCEHPRNKRQWLAQFPGGMMFYLGCHLIDLIYMIQGMPDEVIPFNTATGYEKTTAADNGFALFRYKNGLSFAKTCAAEPGGYMRRQLVICGTRGTIEIRPLEGYADRPNGRLNQYTEVRKVLECNKGWGYDGERSRSPLYNRYDAMMRNFAEIARGEKENPFGYDYEQQLYHLVLRACGAEK